MMDIDNQPAELKPVDAVTDVNSGTQIETIATTQEYSSTSVSYVSSIISQEQSEDNSIASIPSTREGSSDFSLGEQYKVTNTNGDPTAATIEDSFVIIEASDENDSPNKTVTLTNEIKANTPEEVEEYEIGSELRENHQPLSVHGSPQLGWD